MYDGPNYNPDSVQRHAPGQPPWVQAQAKVEHDGAAWQAWQNQKNQQSPSEPLTEDDLRSLMATGVFVVLGGVACPLLPQPHPAWSYVPVT